MSKKKKKGGKARAKRANPSPSKKEFKATPEFKTALGKGLLDFLTSAAANKVAPEPKPEETKEERIQRLLAEQKAAQEGPSNPPLSPLKTLNVRTPDGQRIMWSFSDDDPRSSPRQAEWWWYVTKYLAVNVVCDFQSDSYKVSINQSEDDLSGTLPVGWITGGQAKSLAEALLSAADWERSWKSVMNKDYSHDDWVYYDHKEFDA